MIFPTLYKVRKFSTRYQQSLLIIYFENLYGSMKLWWNISGKNLSFRNAQERYLILRWNDDDDDDV